MLEFIIANQSLILPLLAGVIVWIIAAIWKRSVDKASIVTILATILDIVQDIANNPDTRNLENYQKKDLAVAKAEAALTGKKKNLVTKIFGSVGAAVEFVYKNRNWIFAAFGKIIKGVF